MRYDVNQNGVVDIGDIAVIGQHFNEVVIPPYPRYDVNMDGVVNIADLAIAGQHFGEAT
jgi:Ca2+-binding EF-hand superfamily protein